MLASDNRNQQGPSLLPPDFAPSDLTVQGVVRSDNLRKLELRVREEKVSSDPPGYAVKRLMERIEQIRSRIRPEDLLAYQSEANAEQRQRNVEEIRARLRALRGGEE